MDAICMQALTDHLRFGHKCLNAGVSGRDMHTGYHDFLALAPDVKLLDRNDAWDLFNIMSDITAVSTAWNTFEKNRTAGSYYNISFSMT